MKSIPLTNGQCALVDDADYAAMVGFRWSIHNGYACRRVGNARTGTKRLFMHREILRPRDGFFTDHINRNRLDNRRENLREATPKQNAWNADRSKRRRENLPIGVTRGKAGFEARIMIDGKNKFLGSFGSAPEAAFAYDAAAQARSKDFLHINQPQGATAK